MQATYWGIYALFVISWLLWAFVVGTEICTTLFGNLYVSYGVFVAVCVAMPIAAKWSFRRAFSHLGDKKGNPPGWRW